MTDGKIHNRQVIDWKNAGSYFVWKDEFTHKTSLRTKISIEKKLERQISATAFTLVATNRRRRLFS